MQASMIVDDDCLSNLSCEIMAVWNAVGYPNSPWKPRRRSGLKICYSLLFLRSDGYKIGILRCHAFKIDGGSKRTRNVLAEFETNSLYDI